MEARTLDVGRMPAHTPEIQTLGLGLEDVTALTGIGRTSWLSLVEKGLAPAPRRVTGLRRVFWLRRDVTEWLERQPVGGGAK